MKKNLLLAIFSCLFISSVYSQTQTRDNAGLQGNAGAVSGFFETQNPSNYPSGASGWWHLLDVRHSEITNNYAMQFSGSFSDQHLYFRKTNNSATTPWSRVLLETDGKVGIGTLNPIAGFHIVNSASEGFKFQGSAGSMILSNPSGNNVFNAENNHVFQTGDVQINGNVIIQETLTVDGGDVSFTNDEGWVTVAGDLSVGKHIVTSPGILSNHAVTKAQLDTKANDNAVVKTTGDQTKNGSLYVNGEFLAQRYGASLVVGDESGSIKFNTDYEGGHIFESGAVTINESLTVDGNTFLGGSLNVESTATINTLSVANSTSTGGLTVNGFSTFYDDITAHGAEVNFTNGEGEVNIAGDLKVAKKIIATGKVGIGTANPDEMLTVNGKVHAKEIKVDLNIPAPDYVFEEDYKVPSLFETEQYIKANKHLPEIPSAKEMEKNGISLSEMNMLLLKKIEEMTLQMIEMKKEILEIKSQTK